MVGHTRDLAKRQAPFPSPVRPRRWVTFKEHSTGESALTGTETSNGTEPVGGDLGPHPLLTWTLNTFLEGTHPGREQKEGGTPASPAAQTSPGYDHCEWIEWHSQCVDMPAWWGELWAISDVEDHQELTQKVRASFEVPMVRYQARGGKNDYSTLPAPKCIGKDWFLPRLDPRMGSQDYHLGQPRKTLAYAKALQYWAEKVKPLLPSKSCQLAESILELRQAMEPLITFQDSEVLVGDTSPHGPEVCHTIWAHPMGSFSVACSGRWLGPSIGQVT